MVHLREAVATDAALISRIIASSWRGAYRDLIDPVYLSRLPEEYWLPSMRTWLESGRMYGYIAESGGHAAGCIIYGRGRDDDHADWGEIVSLYLLLDHMGQGIGHQLLTQALSALHEDGYDRVYLWGIDGNHRAELFYRRHGFRPTEDRVQYKIGGRDMTDIRMILEGQA